MRLARFAGRCGPTRRRHAGLDPNVVTPDLIRGRRWLFFHSGCYGPGRSRRPISGKASYVTAERSRVLFPPAFSCRVCTVELTASWPADQLSVQTLARESVHKAQSHFQCSGADAAAATAGGGGRNRPCRISAIAREPSCFFASDALRLCPSPRMPGSRITQVKGGASAAQAARRRTWSDPATR